MGAENTASQRQPSGGCEGTASTGPPSKAQSTAGSSEGIALSPATPLSLDGIPGEDQLGPLDPLGPAYCTWSVVGHPPRHLDGRWVLGGCLLSSERQGILDGHWVAVGGLGQLAGHSTVCPEAGTGREPQAGRVTYCSSGSCTQSGRRSLAEQWRSKMHHTLEEWSGSNAQ